MRARKLPHQVFDASGGGETEVDEHLSGSFELAAPFGPELIEHLRRPRIDVRRRVQRAPQSMCAGDRRGQEGDVLVEDVARVAVDLLTEQPRRASGEAVLVDAGPIVTVLT